MQMEEKNIPRREDVCPTKKGKLNLDVARDQIAGGPLPVDLSRLLGPYRTPPI